MRFALLLILLWSVPADAETVVLVDARIVDVARGTVGAPTTVLIEGDRIASIGAAVPAGGKRVDCAGGYLIPGLVDSHVHLFNTYSKRAPNDWAFPMFVANGVTAVREMAADAESVAIARAWRADAVLVAPRILAIGLPLRGDGPVPAQVEAIAEAGGDFVKLFTSTPLAKYREVEVAAKRHGLGVAGHTPGDAHARDTLRLQTNEHLSQMFEACSSREDEAIAKQSGSGLGEPSPFYADVLAAYDDARCATFARELARTQRAEVPTLAIYRTPSRAVDARWNLLRVDERQRWERILAEPEVFTEPYRAKQWQVALDIVGQLHRANVPILAGTDAPMPLVFPGWSLHEELQSLVEAGLTPADALRAATITPAKIFGDERGGEIAPGFRADLVLLRANPLDDIANTQAIDAVVLRGRHFDRAALDRLLRK